MYGIQTQLRTRNDFFQSRMRKNILKHPLEMENSHTLRAPKGALRVTKFLSTPFMVHRNPID